MYYCSPQTEVLSCAQRGKRFKSYCVHCFLSAQKRRKTSYAQKGKPTLYDVSEILEVAVPTLQSTNNQALKILIVGVCSCTCSLSDPSETFLLSVDNKPTILFRIIIIITLNI